MALVEGVSEEDILKIKQEKITAKTLRSIRTHGWLPDMFRQIIRGAKDFLQEWKDMQKVMGKLQKQSQEIINI